MLASRRSSEDEPPSLRGLFGTTAGHLTLALLVIELVAGMQTYLLSAIRPLVAADLNGQQLYGAVTGVTQVAMFLAIPLGAALVGRFPASVLLIRLTALTAAGACVSALAPGMSVFLAGRALSGLAAGALITVSYGAIVRTLPGPWRRMVLAGYAAVWVVASVLGPTYATWASGVLSWRWTLVLYLPLLLLARIAVARQLRRLEEGPARRAGLSWRPALILAAGVGAVSVLTGTEPWRIALAAGGALLTVAALARLLPAGTFRLRRGMPAIVATFCVLCGAYFGAEAIMAMVAHDVLGVPTSAVGVLLMAGGLGWSVTGLICGRRPPRDERAYRRRAARGALAMTCGLTMCASGAITSTFWILTTGWALAGVGMGMVYLDTIDRILSSSSAGLPEHQATTAAALGETVPTALAATAAAAVLGAVSGDRAGELQHADMGLVSGSVLLVLALLALIMLPALRRARSR